MKRRFLALIMCILIALPMVFFTGCAKEEEEGTIKGDTEDVFRPTQTFVMYVMTEDDTSEEAAEKVSAAISEITESKFKTRLVVRFVKEAEYYSALESEMEQMIEDYNKQNNSSSKPAETKKDEETTEEETLYDEDGFPVLKYPDVNEHQVDIFYLGSYDKFLEYVNQKWLMDITSELKESGKILKDYIPDLFLYTATVNRKIYAVPNNRVMGEYTYILLNKELVDKYYFDPTKITSAVTAKDFLDSVKANEPGYDPIGYGSYDQPTLTYYWSIDPNTLQINSSNFSIIGTSYNASTTFYRDKVSGKIQTNIFNFKSVFSDASYIEQLTALKEYELGGYYADETSDKDFAMKIVKGGAELMDTYGKDYYVNIIDYPRVSTEEVMSSSFAISAKSRGSTKRLMEIVKYLNTNSDMRNLLQYGIEGENYTLNSDGTIKRTPNNEYFMDINKTGNVFAAYPEEGMSADAWTYGIQQSIDTKYDTALGFSFNSLVTKNANVNTDAVKKIFEESEKISKELDAITSMDAFLAKIDECKRAYRTSNSSLGLDKYLVKGQEAEGEATYPITIFLDWCTKNGLISESSD